MKYLLLILCLIFCSCSSKEKAEEPIHSFESCPKSTEEPDPLILECPAEDIAECPVPGGASIKTSVEELSFGKEGGVRCVTTSTMFYLLGGVRCATNFGDVECKCHPEGDKLLERQACSWLTVTKVDDRVMHISVDSVDKNKTVNERRIRMIFFRGNDHGGFTITQSAE